MGPADLDVLCAADEAGAPSARERNYLAENQAAMDRMMSSMRQAPSGDVDRDFVAVMVPHHRGALEMAAAELRYGRNERLRRVAQEIVVTQQQEIQVMQLLARDAETP